MPHTSIIIRAPNWVGDCVMSLPTIQALRAHFPDAQIDIACRAAFADCYRAHPAVNEIIDCPPRGRGLAALAAVWQSGGALRQRRYDLGVLLTNSFSSALWLWRVGARRRIGFTKDARRYFLTDALPITLDIAAAHQADYYLHINETLGASTVRSHPNLIVPEAGKTTAAATLDALGFAHTPYAVLAPVSGYGSVKDWPADRYAEVARIIHAAHHLPVLLVGTPAQREACQAIVTMTNAGGGVFNVCGKTDVGGFFGLIAGATVFLGGDSGGAHVAAALRIPTVAIFGITEPSRTRPLGLRVETVGSGGMSTPRLRDPEVQKTARAALEAITIDDVSAAVSRVMKTSA